MFIVILSYTKPLDEVDVHIDAHMDWIEEQYGLGYFLLSGRREPRTGGFILAHRIDRPALDTILATDPFHRAAVADYAVYQVSPGTADKRLSWLLETNS